jgi:Tol biopolymer transport system component
MIRKLHLALFIVIALLLTACGEEEEWSDRAVRVSPVGLTLVDFAWSRNGEFVASDGVNLWFFDGDGNNLRKIEGSEWFGTMVNGEGLCWSPDGNYVAFTIREPMDGYYADIYIIHRGARYIWEARRLADCFGTNPAWSPDGKWVLFSAWDSILVVPAEGGEPRSVVSNARRPTWNPGGDYFACQRYFGSLNWDIIAKPFNETGGARRITYFHEAASEPAWAPDGKHIAVMVDILKDRSGADIWVVSVKNGSAEKVTEEPEPKFRLEAARPAWSSDGRWVAFLSRRGGEEKGVGGGAIWKVPYQDRSPY